MVDGEIATAAFCRENPGEGRLDTGQDKIYLFNINVLNDIQARR